MSTKLFIPEGIRGHLQDDWAYNQDGLYRDTVPFSEDGIKRHCQVVDTPTKADYIYCGQFPDHWVEPDGHKVTCPDAPKPTIADFDGDWLGVGHVVVQNHVNYQPNFLSINSLEDGGHFLGADAAAVVRPSCSRLLVELARGVGMGGAIGVPTRRSFGFRGNPDRHGTRFRMVAAATMLPSSFFAEVGFTSGFGANVPTEEAFVREYIDVMCNNVFALCPRGDGLNSIRFYEACYFGAIPVAITRAALMGHDWKEGMWWVPTIDDRSPPDVLAGFFQGLMCLSDAEIRERQRLAQAYFAEVVIRYFQDPTLYMLEAMHEARQV